MFAIALLWAGVVLAQNQTRSVQLSVTVTQHSAALAWTASTTTQVTGYNVYRSTTTGTGYVLLGSVAAPTVAYTDKTVLAGKTYYYVVTAVAPACVAGQTIPCGESSYSNEVKAVIPTP